MGKVTQLPDETERDARRMGDIMLRLPKWERKLLLMQAERLLSGLRLYGELDPQDRRRWEVEALEECVDGMSYLGAKLLQLAAQSEE